MIALGLATRQVEASPDARIIVIDLPHYARVGGAAQRSRALEDVFADIEMFEEEAPSRGQTLVFAPDGANLSRILEARTGDDIAAELRGLREVSNAFSGISSGRYQNISLGDVNKALFQSLRRLRIHREPRDKPYHSLDVHVFAPGWRLGSSGPDENVMRTLQATECVIQRQNLSVRLQEWVHVTFEFRVPEGIEKPSESAEATFIGAVTGLHAGAKNVYTRGAAGPRCEMGTGVAAEPYADANFANAPNCNTDIKRLRTAYPAMNACRSSAPLAPPIGVGLDRTPLSLITRPVIAELARPTYDGSFLAQVSGPAQVGGTTIPPMGQAAAGQLPTARPGAFRLSPKPTCIEGQGGSLSLRAADGAIEAVVSRFYCDDARLPIGEVALP